MALVKGSRPGAEAATDLGPRDLASLLADLAAPDSGVRRKAVHGLGAHPDSAMALSDPSCQTVSDPDASGEQRLISVGADLGGGCQSRSSSWRCRSSGESLCM